MWWLVLGSMLATAAEAPAERAKDEGCGVACGAAQGLLFGTAGGMFLSTFGPWYLENGEFVPIALHAALDGAIVGVPGAFIGSVIGGRKERASLRSSRWHLAAAAGVGNHLGQGFVKEAYEDSGYEWHAMWWFGRAHWVNGDTVASPYTIALSADVRPTAGLQIGLGWTDFTRQRIEAVGQVLDDGYRHIGAHEETFVEASPKAPTTYTDGYDIAVFADWVVNPMKPGAKRLEYALGAGIGPSLLVEGGTLGGAQYRIQRWSVAMPVRVTVDWYSTRTTSLQARALTRMHPQLEVPRQSAGAHVIKAHRVEFNGFDLTLGLRTHFGGV